MLVQHLQTYIRYMQAQSISAKYVSIVPKHLPNAEHMDKHEQQTSFMCYIFGSNKSELSSNLT